MFSAQLLRTGDGNMQTTGEDENDMEWTGGIHVFDRFLYSDSHSTMNDCAKETIWEDFQLLRHLANNLKKRTIGISYMLPQHASLIATTNGPIHGITVF